MELEGPIWPNCNPPNTRSVISPLPLAGAPMDFHNRLSEHGLPSEYPIKQPFGGYIYIYCIYILYTSPFPDKAMFIKANSKHSCSIFSPSMGGIKKNDGWFLITHGFRAERLKYLVCKWLNSFERLLEAVTGDEPSTGLTLVYFFGGGTPPIVILDDT